MTDPTGIPIFLTVRDRARDLRVLVDWLQTLGQEDIRLVDNASTYPPLLAYLALAEHIPGITVIRLPENLGARAVWRAALVPTDRPYLVSDPDLRPAPETPADALARLADLLARYPGFAKVGLGLDLRDLAPDAPQRAWEEGLVAPDREREPGVYLSLIDTTCALYRPGARWTYQALRTGFPYVLRHPSWAVTTPDAEDRYYLDRALTGREGSSWVASS